MDKIDTKYDVIIIGAGIGGLVCGCYLAKAGMKVLIVEKNSNVGGYCCSFRRGSFLFDAAVHSFGNFSETTAINKIFAELGMREKITIHRSNPSDIVKVGDMVIRIDNDIYKTCDNISHYFPKEKQNINKFFSYMKTVKALDCFVELRKQTFLHLLESYFEDKRLINVLSFPLGNIGLPADRTAAFSAIMLYRDFILDGGYYPEGGMQNLADTFAKILTGYGCHILTKATVTRILVSNNRAIGIEIDKQRVNSEYVVSNCDGYQTFNKLINADLLSATLRARINTGIPSISSFMLYVGLNINIEKYLEKSCTLWHFDNFNINDIYSAAIDNHVLIPPKYFLATFPSMHEPRLAATGKSIMNLIVGVPFRTKSYWQSNRSRMEDALIEKMNKLVPNFSTMIDVKVNATPHTLYRYTLNSRGAMCGWASTLDQIYKKRVEPSTEIENLYLTGHWTTPPAGQGGVDVVMYSGKTTARLVMTNSRHKKQAVHI